MDQTMANETQFHCKLDPLATGCRHRYFLNIATAWSRQPTNISRGRFGFLDKDALEQDSNCLFITHVYKENDEQGEDITSFSAHHSVYLAFFGKSTNLDIDSDPIHPRHRITRHKEPDGQLKSWEWKAQVHLLLLLRMIPSSMFIFTQQNIVYVSIFIHLYTKETYQPIIQVGWKRCLVSRSLTNLVAHLI